MCLLQIPCLFPLNKFCSNRKTGLPPKITEHYMYLSFCCGREVCAPYDPQRSAGVNLVFSSQSNHGSLDNVRWERDQTKQHSESLILQDGS